MPSDTGSDGLSGCVGGQLIVRKRRVKNDGSATEEAGRGMVHVVLGEHHPFPRSIKPIRCALHH